MGDLTELVEITKNFSGKSLTYPDKKIIGAISRDRLLEENLSITNLMKNISYFQNRFNVRMEQMKFFSQSKEKLNIKDFVPRFTGEQSSGLLGFLKPTISKGDYLFLIDKNKKNFYIRLPKILNFY